MHMYAYVPQLPQDKNRCGASDIGVLGGGKLSGDRTEMGDTLWTVYPEPCDYVTYTNILTKVKKLGRLGGSVG